MFYHEITCRHAIDIPKLYTAVDPLYFTFSGFLLYVTLFVYENNTYF